MKNKIIKAFVPLAPVIWEALQSENRKGLIYLFLLQSIRVISIVLPGAPFVITNKISR